MLGPHPHRLEFSQMLPMPRLTTVLMVWTTPTPLPPPPPPSPPALPNETFKRTTRLVQIIWHVCNHTERTHRSILYAVTSLCWYVAYNEHSLRHYHPPRANSPIPCLVPWTTKRCYVLLAKLLLWVYLLSLNQDIHTWYIIGNVGKTDSVSILCLLSLNQDIHTRKAYNIGKMLAKLLLWVCLLSLN